MATTIRRPRSAPRRTAEQSGRYAASRREEDGHDREMPRERSRIDPKAHGWDAGLFIAIILLLGIGLIALFSASYSSGLYHHGSATYFIRRQAPLALGGVMVMIVVSFIPYRVYSRFWKLIMWASIAMLVLVLTPLGTVSGGARRWLFGFQPSEIAKLTIILCFAYWISRDAKSVRSFKGLIKPYGLLMITYAGLLFLEPHNSGALIVCGIGVIVLVVGGMRLWYFGPIIAAGAGFLVLAYSKYEHVRERFAVWLDPFIDMTDKGYQGSMSQIAIGSGGLFGYGLGQGRQKHLYLPEPQNDFIFASWCEEMGLIGAMIVILLFVYLIFRGFYVASNAPDRFSTLVAAGITAKFSIQTLMNLFVVTGIIPITGASLPFFSYGGTALLMQLVEMGILLNISRYMRIDARQKE